MLERIQLNLRLDGRRDLLDAIKVAAAREGLSVNAFVIKALEDATATETATTGKKKQPTAPATTKSLILEVLDKPLDKPGELSSTLPLDKPGKLSSTLPLDKPGELSSTLPLDKPGELSSILPLDSKPLDDDIGKSSTNEILDTLRAENELLKTDYSKLLESSTHVTAKLREEVRQLRSQVQAERAKQEELQEELGDRPEIQKSVSAVAEFPEAAVVLNQLKARRKKSRADLADVEAVLEILGSES